MSESVCYAPSNQTLQLLSCSVDRNDNGTVQSLLTQLKLFVDQEKKKTQVIEPTIRPLEGALVRTEIDYTHTKHELPGLVDIGVNGNNADSDPLKALEHLTTYWVPEGGEIKILTTSIAENIASITGCSLYPEPLEARVRLVGGDFSDALKKLQNLEPLLVSHSSSLVDTCGINALQALQYQQRQYSTVKTNANALLQTTNDSNPVMEFERVNNSDHAAFRRIITSDGPQVLHGKCLCELRIAGVPKEDSIPRNLMLMDITDTNIVGGSLIWDKFTYATLGAASSKDPRTQAIDDSDKKSTLSFNSKIGNNEFMDPSKVARVAQWTGQVDENVDPNLVAPEAPEQAPGRRRILAVDSDDEDDEDDEQQATAPATAKATSVEPLPSMLSPPPAAEAPRNVSVAASVAASDLLKVAPSEASVSMMPAASAPAIAIRPSPEPEIFTSYRTRVVGEDSDSESAASDGGPTQDCEAICTPVETSTATAAQEKPGKTSAGEDPGEAPVNQPADESSQPKAPTFRPLDGASSTIVSTAPPAQSVNFRGSSPERLWTTVSLPGKGFDPNAYGPKAGNTRGARGFFRPSPKTTAASKIKPITIPSRDAFPDGLAPEINTGGFTPKTPSPPQPAHPYRGPSPPNGNGKGKVKSGPTKRGTRHRGRGGNKKAAQAQQQASKQSAKLIDVSETESQPVANERSTEVNDVWEQEAVAATTDQPAELIDVSDEGCSSRDPSPPPPGFDLKIEPIKKQPRSATPNLADEPMQERRPISRATNSDLMTFSSGSRLRPVSRASRESRESDETASYVNTVAYKGPNIEALKNNTLARLKAAQAERKEREQKAEQAKAMAKAQTRGRSGNGLRSTMNQQAGNPGKKGLQKQESKAEKKMRQEQALRDAYGDLTPAKPQKVDADRSDMSKTKRPNSNLNMAVANSEALLVESRQRATESMMSGLSPIFEATRAFSGDVKFELQFGQLLISSDSSIREKAVTPKKWEKLFGPLAKTPILTSFTNVLTTNGADLDRALEAKAFKGGKLWDAGSPGPESVQYEFECQSKHGKQFLLILDQSGSYELRSSSATTVGMVGLYCPGQVWDACAVVSGNENWDTPAEIKSTVASFVDSIHVLPNRRELVLVFRQPDDNELMIKNVSMRRVSSHQCLIPDYQDYHLQATEVKILHTKVHPEDKKLWQAYEKSHTEMIQDGLVYHELSIIHKGINNVLSGNKALELGELASPSAGKESLKGDRIKKMIDLAAHMISKIDWMGSRNNGTLARAAAAREIQMIRQQQSLPPIARSKINPLVAASRIDPTSRLGGHQGSSYPMSSAGGGSEVYIGKRPVPGTRYGTLAEVYEDEHGRFAKGFGGARVPLGDYSVLGAISEAPLEPDDSASQIGMARRGGGMGRGRGGARSGVGIHGDKGPGFW